MRKIRVKQSKGQSFFGMMIGILFIFIGFTMFIPELGIFGFFWTAVALIITIINGYNVFSNRGLANYELDIEGEHVKVEVDFEMKLRKLNQLRKDGINTESEFLKKKEKILDQDI